jgi:hypothetical protein
MQNFEAKSWNVRTTDFKQSEFAPGSVGCTTKGLTIAGLKKLAMFWLLAVFCIFIPVLHFFLVPLFLIVGVVAMVTQMKNTHHLEHGTFTCPNCHEPMAVKDFYFSNGKRFRCKSCSQQLVLEC